MKVRIYYLFNIVLFLIVLSIQVNAQALQRERPAEWKNLVLGGMFLDRFLPIPTLGVLTERTWGAANVVPRYIDNGIEDSEWSYWGGNILTGDDGKFHLFVCRWRENSPKGHGEWPNSIVVHAKADNSIGPFKVEGIVGQGHNPEAFRIKDGRYVIYVIDGYYISDDIDGPWDYKKFEFESRDRRIIEGLSNLSFAQREDGSFIMVCRGGGIWFSKDGISPYNQVTDTSVYPDVEGEFEDPVIWRDNIQYNMIVNDWLGRIAYYLRSKDGINWKIDAGEAYIPGITKYEDGTVEDWYKYERIKVLQDEYGRAVQANFAVIDTLKREDKPNDNHSSKNISIPLTKCLLINILNEKIIDGQTKSILIKINAEAGFDPNTDIDLNSLHFGASEEVNFGRGSMMQKVEKSGNDLIVTFSGDGNGITENNFVAKLLGKTNQGKLLYGYARLPWLDYLEPALSSRLPVLQTNASGYEIEVEIQNFGQVASHAGTIKIEQIANGQYLEIAKSDVPKLDPFQKTNVKLGCDKKFVPEVDSQIRVIILSNGQNPVTFEGQLKTN